MTDRRTDMTKPIGSTFANAPKIKQTKWIGATKEHEKNSRR